MELERAPDDGAKGTQDPAAADEQKTTEAATQDGLSHDDLGDAENGDEPDLAAIDRVYR